MEVRCPVGEPSETSVERGYRLGLPAQRHGERFFGYLEPRPPWRGPWRAREASARPILLPAKLSCRR